MAFDIDGARKEGYSDAEIADHLGKQRGFDTAAARQEGYDDSEILGHLAGQRTQQPAPATAPTQTALPVAANTGANTEKTDLQDIWQGVKNVPGVASAIARDIAARSNQWAGENLVKPIAKPLYALADIAMNPNDPYAGMSPSERKQYGGNPDEARFGDDDILTAAGKQQAAIAKQDIRELGSKLKPNGYGSMVQGGLVSAAQNTVNIAAAAGIALATKGGSLATPATAALVQNITLGLMGAQSGVQTYGEKRDAGFGVADSNIMGAGSGGLEVATEKLPLGSLMKLVTPGAKKGVTQFMKGLGEYALQDVGGEIINTLVGDVIYDKISSRPGITDAEAIKSVSDYFESGEAWNAVKQTIGTTLVQSGAMGGSAALIRKLTTPKTATGENQTDSASSQAIPAANAPNAPAAIPVDLNVSVAPQASPDVLNDIKMASRQGIPTANPPANDASLGDVIPGSANTVAVAQDHDMLGSANTSRASAPIQSISQLVADRRAGHVSPEVIQLQNGQAIPTNPYTDLADMQTQPTAIPVGTGTDGQQLQRPSISEGAAAGNVKPATLPEVHQSVAEIQNTIQSLHQQMKAEKSNNAAKKQMRQQIEELHGVLAENIKTMREMESAVAPPAQHSTLPVELSVRHSDPITKGNSAATFHSEAPYVLEYKNTVSGTSTITKHATFEEALSARDNALNKIDTQRSDARTKGGNLFELQQMADELIKRGDEFGHGVDARIGQALDGTMPEPSDKEMEFYRERYNVNTGVAPETKYKTPSGWKVQPASEGRSVYTSEASGKIAYSPKHKQWVFTPAIGQSESFSKLDDAFEAMADDDGSELIEAQPQKAAKTSAPAVPEGSPEAAKPSLAEVTSDDRLVQHFAGMLAKTMESGKGLDKVKVIQSLADMTGKKYKEISAAFDNQDLDLKGIEEKIERAVVQLARAVMSKEGVSFSDKLAEIERLYAMQPNLAHRTGDSKALQQYSTPAPIAAILADHLGMSTAEAVYEPTAGNGMLVIGANPEAVTANELDTRRNESLQEQGFKKVLNQDAMDDVAAVRDKSQDVVIMNPPFGVADNSMTVDGVELTQREHIIAAQALDKMADAGSAAIIIGGHNFDKGKMRGSDWAFLNWLYNNYNVDHNINVDGKLYSRQGTSYSIRVITVQGRKTGKSDEIYIPQQVSDKRAAEAGITADVVGSFDALRAELKTKKAATEAQDGTVQGNVRKRVSGDSKQAQSDEATGLDQADESKGGLPRSDSDSAGLGSGAGDSKSATVPSKGRGRGNESSDGTDRNAGRGTSELQPGRHSGSDESGAAGDGAGIDDFDAAWEAEATKRKAAEQKKNVDKITKRKPAAKTGDRTAKDAAVAAQDSAADAVKQAGAAIAEILRNASNPNKLNSGFTFDDATYQKIKPLMQSAWEKSKAAASDAAEALSKFISDMMDAVGDMAAQFKPYIKQFYTEATASPEENKQEEKQQEQPKEAVETELQATYPQKSKGGSTGKLAPRNLARLMNTALESLETEVGDIDQYVQDKLGYESGKDLFHALSGEQIDAVALAIHSIDKGQGVIIGDQTGVGKGRIASAVMLYAKNLGMKPIFVTEKPKLYSDIHRDMMDIMESHPDEVMRPFIVGATSESDIVDGDNKVVHTYFNGMRNEPKGNRKEGAIVGQKERYQRIIDGGAESLDAFDYIAVTYSQLQGPDGSQRRGMVTQLAHNNILIMDEAHNAAGESAIGEYFKALMPLAKGVTYLSATYAKRPSAMALYSRTELSQSGMSQQDLEAAITNGGVPMQQIIASLLAEGGQYIRRENDYSEMDRPTISINTDAKATKDLERKMDSTTDILRDIVAFSRVFGLHVKHDIAQSINGSVQRKEDRAGVSSSNFASVVHNYVRQLSFALKVDGMVEEAVVALERGEKPLFYIDNTMNSFLEDYAKEVGIVKGDVVDINFGDVLMRATNNLLTYSVKKPGSRESEKVKVEYDDLPPSLQNMYDEISDKVNEYQIDVTASPIDALSARLKKAYKEKTGKDLNVGEITGRSTMVDMSGEEHRYVNRSETSRNDIVNGFNGNGTGTKYDVVIFNQAGATGLSLHPTEKTGDKRPRTMFIVQPSLNIDSYLQALGRIFRTGQIHKPKYVNALLNLPSETRPAIIQNRKLASINANLAAKSEGVFTMDVPNMDNLYGDKIIEEYLREHGDMASELAIDVGAEDAEATKDGMFNTFSGRLALLPVSQQKDVWADVIAAYNSHIDFVNEMGENKLVAKDYDFKAKTLSSDTLQERMGEGIFQGAANLETVEAQIIKKPYKFAKVDQLVESELGGKDSVDHSDAILGKIKTAHRATVEPMYAELRSINEERVVLKEGDPKLAELDKAAEDINKKAGSIDKGMDLIKELMDDMLVGEVYSMALDSADDARSTVALLSINYKPGTSGSPVAPSKLSFTFAVAGPHQKITIPASKANILMTAHRIADDREVLARRWDNLTPSRDTETRHIVTGNLLAGMKKASGNGHIVYYTTAQGERKPGILINQSKSAKEWMQTVRDRITVTADSIKAILKSSKPDHITVESGILTTLTYDKYRDRWRLAVLGTKVGEKVYSDAGLKDLSVSGRFDLSKQSGGLQIAYFHADAINGVVDGLSRIFGGHLTFTVTKAAAGIKQETDGGTQMNSGVDPTQIVKAITGLYKNLKQDMPRLVKLAEHVLQQGKVKYQDYLQAMKSYLGDKFKAYRDDLRKIYNRALDTYKGTFLGDNRGQVGYDLNKGEQDDGRSSERLRSKENAKKLSVPFQAALDVYRANGGTSRENLERLKGYAAEKGLIIDSAPFYKEWEGGKKIHGGENTVLFKDGHAQKLNDLGYHQGDISEFLDRMLAHNSYFPDAAYELMGFVQNKEQLLPMVRQKFVQAATDVKTSLTHIASELRKSGFVLADRESGMWITPDGRYEMFDAGRSNVITDTEGNLHFIDAVFLPRPATAAELDEAVRVPLADGTKLSLASPSALTSSADQARAELKRLGLYDDIVLDFVTDITNDGVEGSQRGALIEIAMTAQDPIGVLHHEVIHLLRQHRLISDKEWSALKDASTQWFANHPDRSTLTARYNEYRQRGMTAEQISEERIADMFRGFGDAQRTTQTALVQKVMDKLTSFFRALGRAFKGNGFVDAKSVMQAIYDGKKTKESGSIGDAIARIGVKIKDELWDSASSMGSQYLDWRYNAKGLIKLSEIEAVRHLDTLIPFTRNNPKVAAAFFEYMTTKDADVSMLPEAAQQAAIESKRAIIELGENLVEHGIISEATFEKYEGSYLPNMYLKFILGEDALGKMIATGGQGGKKMDLSYAKKRNDDLSKDVKELVYGQVKDVAYLVHSALSRGGRDMALAKWFSAIASVPEYTMQKMLADWNLNKNPTYRIGMGLQYTKNDDDTFNVVTRKVERGVQNFKGVDSEFITAHFSEAVSGYVTKHMTGEWNQVGELEFRVGSKGAIDIKLHTKTPVTRTHRNTPEDDLNKLVGARRAGWMRTGKVTGNNSRTGATERPVKTVGGIQVTPFYLVKEALRMERMADYQDKNDSPDYDPNLAESTRKEAKRMKDMAREVLTEAGYDFENDLNHDTLEMRPAALPDGWRQMPNTAKYGKLGGMVVRKAIYDDIVNAYGGKSGDKSWFEKAFGQDGSITVVHKVWKSFKSTMNPPTHVANALSNFINMHSNTKGMSVSDAAKYLHRAIKETVNKGRYYQIGIMGGFVDASFTSNETAQINMELIKFLHHAKGNINAYDLLKYYSSMIYKKAGDAYQISETIFKTAVLMYEMEKNNLTQAEAVRKAHYTLFDYNDVGPSARFIRNFPFLGSPFFTYFLKSTGQGIINTHTAFVDSKAAINGTGGATKKAKDLWSATEYHRKVLTWNAAMLTLPVLIAGMVGLDDDDLDKYFAALPQFMQEKGHMLMMVYKGDDGKLTYLDASRVMPWSPQVGVAKHVASGKIGSVLTKDAGLLGGPVPTAIAAIMTNRDPFSGAEIIPKKEHMTPAEKIATVFEYGYNLMAPFVVTKYGPIAKGAKAATEHVNKRTGDRDAYMSEAVTSAFGLPTKRVDPVRSRQNELARLRSAVSDLQSAKRDVLNDRNTTPDGRAKAIKFYDAKIQDARDAITDFTSATNFSGRSLK